MSASIFIFFLVLLSLNSNGQKIQSVRAVSIPLYMSSTFQISCKQIDIEFPEEKHDTTLRKSKNILEIQQLLLKSKLTKLSGIDVRGKLTVIYVGKKIKTLCFDEFGNFVDGSFIYQNKFLLDYLVKKNVVSYN